jgi:hypothetical protein
MPSVDPKVVFVPAPGAIDAGSCPSSLVYLTVQLASRSFWRSLAGFFAHCGGMRPSLMSRFSPLGCSARRQSRHRDLPAHRQAGGSRAD